MTAKFNLAPEVYQTSQRNKRRRRSVTSIAIVVNVVAVGIVVLALVIIGGQKIAIAVLDGQIKTGQDKVKTYADLPDAVTAQQHLLSLGNLATQQVYFSRFFTVLQNVAPSGLAVNKATVGSANTLELTGTAPDYNTITKFAKALAAYNVTVGTNASPTQQPYFTNVSLGQVAKDNNNVVTFKLDTQMSNQVTTNGNK